MIWAVQLVDVTDIQKKPSLNFWFPCLILILFPIHLSDALFSLPVLFSGISPWLSLPRASRMNEPTSLLIPLNVTCLPALIEWEYCSAGKAPDLLLQVTTIHDGPSSPFSLSNCWENTLYQRAQCEYWQLSWAPSSNKGIWQLS